MATYRIDAIEGIGPAYAEKLKAAGITTVQVLLKKGATPQGRKALAEETGISPQLILKWVNMADLFRIPGIGTQYAELLEAAGVDTVKELRHRNPENLWNKMKEINNEKKLVRQLPSLKQVEAWVAYAKQLEPAVSY